ncbi:hypothetical protein SAMN04488505_107260 [Chitinophaga rupis]|uniref:Uncharacterized protein n=1 Tax=Chitinophaga rupis TaxID=573321 RepID=A0A1H8CY58_9BACT|nr:hypothetical protein SAMN04488505_107260 [Chitinophaga rupis]
MIQLDSKILNTSEQAIFYALQRQIDAEISFDREVQKLRICGRIKVEVKK